MRINVNSIDFKGSLINGPGIRSLLFLQGCSRHCPGCHNPSTWSPDMGEPYDVKELARIIEAGCKNRKLTITGGEPLEQAEALEELLDELEGFDICLYTSYGRDQIPRGIESRLTYIKTGEYVNDKRTTTTPFIGSTNQKFIKIRG